MGTFMICATRHSVYSTVPSTVWAQGLNWPSGSFGASSRRALWCFCLFRRCRVRTWCVLFPPLPWQEIVDGGLDVRPKCVVHLWVHDLSDDPVHTGLQHARPECDKKRTQAVTQATATIITTITIERRVASQPSRQADEGHTHCTTLCLSPFLIWFLLMDGFQSCVLRCEVTKLSTFCRRFW